MKILIADDDQISRRMLAAMLVRWGHDVTAAEDGEQAWSLLQAANAPQMAIFDWQMPGIDGIEICRRLRAWKEAPYFYLILITGRDSDDDIAAGMDAGADDYIVKPMDATKLKARINAGARVLNLQTQLMSMVDSLREAEYEVAIAQKREAETGGRIQQTLLLGEPPKDLAGARAGAMSLPSQTVDADFYDFFRVNDEVFEVLVGDVMGKGVTGALIGAGVKSQVQRALSQLLFADSRNLPEPEEIIRRVHAVVTPQLLSIDAFCTLAYARFTRGSMQMTLVNCGHPPPIVWRSRDGSCERIEHGGTPLGFMNEETYTQIEIPYEHGDLVFFYSDGVTEAQNETGEMFGIARLVELIQRSGKVEPTRLNDRVRAAVAAFTHTGKLADDVTCVAVKIDEVPDVKPTFHEELTVTSQLSQLSRVRSFIAQHCQAQAGTFLDDVALNELLLAINEASSNIMRHAYGLALDREIIVTLDIFSDRVVTRLIHGGAGFNLRDVPPPSFDGSRDGGFGIYMIAQCVDEVAYLTLPNGRHCVQLIKKGKNL